MTSYGASQVALVVKNVCANVREDVRDTGSISGSGRSPSAGALHRKSHYDMTQNYMKFS